MRVVIVEPDAKGRVSGGYRYNHELAQAHAALHLVSVEHHALAQCLRDVDLEARDWLLLDSLFLNAGDLAPFFEARSRTGVRLGLLLHAFPSFVEHARSDHRAALTDPRLLPEEEEQVRRLDVVVCPGPYGRRVLEASGVPTRAIQCSPGRIVVPETLAKPRAQAPPRLLTVANVTRGKGYSDGVAALYELRRFPWEWEVVGSLDWEPEFVDELRREVARLGMEERIHFRGHLEHARARALYPHSDVFLFPSLTENHPLVLLEAQAYGVPAVAYAVGGVPDIVKDGAFGFAAPPFDVRRLSRCVERLLLDAELRENLARAGRENAARQPTWEQSAEALVRELRAPPPGTPALV